MVAHYLFRVTQPTRQCSARAITVTFLLSVAVLKSTEFKRKSRPPKTQLVRGVFMLNCWIKLCNPICNQVQSGCLSCQGCHPHVSGLCLHQLFPPALHLRLSLLLLGVAALPPAAPSGSPGLKFCSSQHLQTLLLLLRPPDLPIQGPQWAQAMQQAWR